MVFSIRHSSIQDSRIPLRLVYLGFQHGMEFSNYPKIVYIDRHTPCASVRNQYVRDIYIHSGMRGRSCIPECFLACDDVYRYVENLGNFHESIDMPADTRGHVVGGASFAPLIAELSGRAAKSHP